MTERKKDPTVTSAVGGDSYPEGTHPARPASEVTHAADKRRYKDNPDKPDKTTIAQVEVTAEDK